MYNVSSAYFRHYFLFGKPGSPLQHKVENHQASLCLDQGIWWMQSLSGREILIRFTHEKTSLKKRTEIMQKCRHREEHLLKYF